ncbi:MAG: alpha/beta fold hydrolase [Chloroflexi bacterium]|nr:alpha/beta fold hydrolase [Chloroflexota bacterium]
MFANEGITIHCPLLPGHGNLPYQIHGYGKKDWLAEAEEAFLTLQKKYDQIFVIGHSMGAVQAAYLAHKYQNAVCGLILMAPLYDVPDWRIKMASFGRYSHALVLSAETERSGSGYFPGAGHRL